MYGGFEGAHAGILCTIQFSTRVEVLLYLVVIVNNMDTGTSCCVVYNKQENRAAIAHVYEPAALSSVASASLHHLHQVDHN